MRRSLSICWIGIFAAWFGLGCPGEADVKQLTLSITSEAPPSGSSLDTIRILFRSGETQYPEASNDERFNLSVIAERDLATTPLYVAVDSSGATFSGNNVWIQVSGLSEGKVVTQYEGLLSLQDIQIVPIRLRVIPAECDEDGDSFMDCSIAGCCAEGASSFNDCEPDDPTANPWAPEAACEPCSDTKDQNCDGVDVPCIDEDNDGVADCEEVTCGAGDPDVAPGLGELCDGKDNNCDGTVDEGFLLGEKSTQLSVGEACGLGTCEGIVVCASEDEVTCAYDIGPIAEICGDGLDNDCDGVPDNGCEKTDIDGDGYPEENDCNDLDSATYPNAEEGCCPAMLEGNPDVELICDKNCDKQLVFCDPEDGDGDGYWGQDDCDPFDATVHVGAPEKCGDGIDQDCFGGDLPCDGVVDEDGDQWPASVDCDDANHTVHPNAAELCDDIDNDCDGIVDEGNPGSPQGNPCTIDKLIGVCKIGKPACDHSGASATVICLGEVLPSSELCDNLDNDCDGETDEGLLYEGTPIGAECVGKGQCGQGVVQCQVEGTDVTCSTMPDGSESQASPEICDGLDNDCNGIAEDAVDIDGDGQTECEGDCDDTEATVMYGGLEICDFLDNDCDGLIDELDADNDGFSACWGGGDCDDFDASSYPVVLDGNVEGIGEGTFTSPYKSLSTAFANLNPNCPTVLIVPGTHEIEGSWTQQGEVRLLGGGAHPENTTIKPFPTNSRILRAFPGSSIILENLTAFGGDSDVPGTVLYAEEGTTSTLLNVEILDNQSTAQGGAISVLGGFLHTIDSTFSYNTASTGGAIYIESGEYIDEGSSFIANEATNGGGLGTQNTSVTLNGTRFKGNIASENGGGLWTDTPLSFSTSDTSVQNNEAANWGGGLYLSNAYQTPYIIKNAKVQGNTALNGGGFAIADVQGAGIVANSTFVDNHAPEQGADITLDIDSTAGGNYLWSNLFAYSSGLSGVYVTEAAAANIAYNICWSSGDECMSFPTTADGGNNLYDDPLFSLFIDDGALVGDDFSLQSTSPAIDSGPLDGEGPSYYTTWQDSDGSQNDRGYTGGQ